MTNDVKGSDDAVMVKCHTDVSNTGIDKNSTITALLELASSKGEKELLDYSKYCANLTKVMQTVTKAIDLDNLETIENPTTGEVIYRAHAQLGDTKWTYTVKSKQQDTIKKYSVNGVPHIDYNNLVTETIKEGGVSVYSATYMSSIVIGAGEFVTGLATAFCTAKVTQAVKSAEASSKAARSGRVFKLSSESYREAVERDVSIAVRKSVGRTTKVVARLSTPANAIMIALLVTSVIIAFLAKSTIWQFTILNKSDQDIYWTSVLEHGDLKSCPVDAETNQPYRKIQKSYFEKGEDGWPDEISYTRAELTYDNEGALFGITGNLIFRLQEDSLLDQPKFNFAFNIPYSGANSVEMTTETGLTQKETDNLTYQLIDEENNLKFTFSLSYEHDKHSVPTINEGESGWNYTSALTISNYKESDNA